MHGNSYVFWLWLVIATITTPFVSYYLARAIMPVILRMFGMQIKS